MNEYFQGRKRIGEVWICQSCGTEFAEYHNGCPKSQCDNAKKRGLICVPVYADATTTAPAYLCSSLCRYNHHRAGRCQMSYQLRKVVRNKRHLDAISRVELDNLRNRLTASRNAANYNDRTHVDVPSDLLERMLTALEGVVTP